MALEWESKKSRYGQRGERGGGRRRRRRRRRSADKTVCCETE
jgi:hypothetical protein